MHWFHNKTNVPNQKKEEEEKFKGKISCMVKVKKMWREDYVTSKLFNGITIDLLRA